MGQHFWSPAQPAQYAHDHLIDFDLDLFRPCYDLLVPSCKLAYRRFEQRLPEPLLFSPLSTSLMDIRYSGFVGFRGESRDEGNFFSFSSLLKYF